MLIHRRGGRAAAAVLAFGLLAGCGSPAGERAPTGAGPTGQPTSSAAPAPSSAPAPVPSTTVAPTTAATTPSTTSVPRLESTPGPYGVGYTRMTLPGDGVEPALAVHVWYPARAAGERATYEIIPGLEIPARLAAPEAAPAGGPFPVVLYSHGSGGFGLDATFFTEVLASHGYVVAAPDHPGDTVVDAFLRMQSESSLDLVAATEGRVGDLRRSLDAVVASSGAGGPLEGTVDDGRVILAGHSLGGAGALLAADELAADALVVMDPSIQVVPPPAAAAVRVPVLVMTGDVVPAGTPYELGAGGPWVHVAAPTITHEAFTDICAYGSLLPGWLAAGAPEVLRFYLEGTISRSCQPPSMAPERVYDVVDGYTLAFLGAVERGTGAWDALVDQPQPDVTVVRHAGTGP